jgi:hypothetical protein
VKRTRSIVLRKRKPREQAIMLRPREVAELSLTLGPVGRLALALIKDGIEAWRECAGLPRRRKRRSRRQTTGEK